MSSRPFLRGVLACAPIAASVVPFGVIAAVSAGEAGLSGLQTAAMSIIVFAGAAQLASLELAKSDAPALFVIGAALVVNLRFAMYSAALARYVRLLPARFRAVMSYGLTDQAFALAVPELEDGPIPRGGWFFLGAAATLWTAWQLGTLLGIALGAAVPPELSLDFCVALAFVALAVPNLRDRPTLGAGAASVVVFLLASGLPYGLALVPAAASGVAVGATLEAAAR